MIFMDALGRTTLLNAYADKESYQTVHPLLLKLKTKGLIPSYVTMDGHLHVMRAFRDVWSGIMIQRCLYHIQRQGLSWIRTSPKTQAGRELKALLLKLCEIRSFKERDIFVSLFYRWIELYRSFVKSLPSSSVAFKDLKRTVALIKNALPDMFHYLSDPKIPATTNALESFYSILKADFQRHRGLSEKHKQSYLRWYCYFKNKRKIATLFQY